MNSSQRSAVGPHDGHALSVEWIIGAPAETIFDAFIAMYDSQRPPWVRTLPASAPPWISRSRPFRTGTGSAWCSRASPRPPTRDDFAGAWPDVLAELAGRLSS